MITLKTTGWNRATIVVVKDAQHLYREDLKHLTCEEKDELISLLMDTYYQAADRAAEVAYGDDL